MKYKLTQPGPYDRYLQLPLVGRPSDVTAAREYDHRPDFPLIEKALARAAYFAAKRVERENAPLNLNETRVTLRTATREQTVDALHGAVTPKKRR